MAVSNVYLQNGLAPNGTVVIAYPAGVTAAQVAMAERTFMVGSTTYVETTYFTLSLGTSYMTLTWLGPSTIPPLSSAGLHIQLADPVEAVQSAFGRRLDSFGDVDTTGTVRMDTLIQSAVEECADLGVPLLIGPGDYAIGADVQLASGAKIVMSPHTRLIRKYSGGSVFTQASLLTPLVGVEIHGNGASIVNPDPTVYTTGRSLSLYLDRSFIDNLFLDGHNDAGTVAQLRLTRSRMNRIVHIESTRTGGGITLHGSTDSRVSDCYVDCDDDCYQIGATGLESSPFFGLDTRGVQYVNCTGRSRNARLMVVGAARAGLEPLISAANVTDCAFIGVRGKGRLGITIVNTLLTGKVARHDFIGCQVDCSSDTTGGTSAISITDNNVAGSGGIEDIRFFGGGITSPYHSAVNVYGTNVKRISFDGVFFGKSRGGRNTGLVDDFADVSFNNCTFECPPSPDYGVRVGALAAGHTPRALFKGCVFFDIGLARDGILFSKAGYGRVEECRFVEESGATTAQAFTVSDGCLNVTVGRNDYDGLTFVDKFNWPAAPGAGCAIETRGLKATSASATLRTYESGSDIVLTGATNRNYNLPACRYGLRYSLTQQGTGLAKFTAASGDVIQVGSSTSAAAGNIESTAQGDSVQIIGIDDTTWLAASRSGTWTVT